MRPISRYWLLLVAAALLLWQAPITPAPGPANDFHFSIVGDRTGNATPEIYGRVWREIDLLHPDFVVNVGDTIQGGQDAAAESEWQALRPVRRRYGYPLYFTPGNHDIWSDRSRRIYEKETGRSPQYSFDIQEAHFTVLDNSRTDSLGPDQLRFLEDDLARNRQRRPKFVFFHRPFWVLPLSLGSGEFELHRLALKYGIDYVVSGHVHRFIRMARDGVVYMAVGSSGASLRGQSAGFAEGWFHGYMWVRVRGARAWFTVKELDGRAGSGRMFRAEDWGVGGPKFDPSDPAAIDKPET